MAQTLRRDIELIGGLMDVIVWHESKQQTVPDDYPEHHWDTIKEALVRLKSEVQSDLYRIERMEND